MTLRKNQSAFTLLEIMIVVTIIALLMGAAIYKLGGNVEYARHIRIGADIQGINTQLKLYESMNGFMPTTEQGLQALVTQPDTDPRPVRWYQLYKELPKDPWQNTYIYRNPGLKNPSSYDLFSAGPDRIPDTADDDWGQ
jgi:general secretion pathway protein G